MQGNALHVLNLFTPAALHFLAGNAEPDTPIYYCEVHDEIYAGKKVIVRACREGFCTVSWTQSNMHSLALLVEGGLLPEPITVEALRWLAHVMQPPVGGAVHAAQ